MISVQKKVMSRILQLTQNMKNIPKGRARHFSFLVCKNTILSIGWNDYNKTHTLAKKFGYYNGNIHSELACIVSCQRDLKNCIMVNTRIGHNNEYLMSKPCKHCQRLLLWYNIDNILYSTIEGFECLNMKTNLKMNFMQFQKKF